MKSQALAIGLIVSVGVHAAVFAAGPGVPIGTWEGTAREFHAVQLPPEVRVPPPPEAIARPATPRVSASPDISEDVTIAPTDFEHNPVSSLAPPPKRGRSSDDARPAFVPYEVAPKLKNGREVQALLQRRYPKSLRNAGIEGRVVVWIHVSDEGLQGREGTSGDAPRVDPRAARG